MPLVVKHCVFGAAATYTLANGYTAELSGWGATRTYTKGFLQGSEGPAEAKVSGLIAGDTYAYKVGVPKSPTTRVGLERQNSVFML